ncbi:unnamed protein product [Absidia cylindrospora]
MVDASDNFKVDEHFLNAPIDDEDCLKAEKRAAKVKAKEAKQADKEAKEEQRKINCENREKKKKLKDKNKKRKRGEEVSDDEGEQGDAEKTGGDGSKKAKKEKPAEEHGVWVGNLAFATSQMVSADTLKTVVKLLASSVPKVMVVKNKTKGKIARKHCLKKKGEIESGIHHPFFLFLCGELC